MDVFQNVVRSSLGFRLSGPGVSCPGDLHSLLPAMDSKALLLKAMQASKMGTGFPGASALLPLFLSVCVAYSSLLHRIPFKATLTMEHIGSQDSCNRASDEAKTDITEILDLCRTFQLGNRRFIEQ